MRTFHLLGARTFESFDSCRNAPSIERRARVMIGITCYLSLQVDVPCMYDL